VEGYIYVDGYTEDRHTLVQDNEGYGSHGNFFGNGKGCGSFGFIDGDGMSEQEKPNV
jgi:hypothetical protein